MREVVLHIIPGLKVGGAEMMLCRLMESSLSEQYENIVISLTPGGGMLERFNSAGVKLIVLDIKSKPFSDFLKLIFLIKNIKPALVQTWLYHADLVGGVAARLSGVKNIVWGIRTTDVGQGSSLLVRFVRKLCAFLSYIIPRKIVCVAHAALNLHGLVGYAKKKMLVIHNGLSVNSWPVISGSKKTDLRRSNGIDSERLVIGMLGRFSEVKNQLQFIKMASAVSERNSNVSFLLVGRDCDFDNGQLVGWLNEYAVSDKFYLLGERNDVANCLAMMDIFVLPSKTEGFPNVLAEAMLMRLPCIASDVGDSKLVLGQAGMLVEVDALTELVAAVEHFCSISVCKRESIGRISREKIIENFSLEVCSAQYSRLYSEIISGH